MAAARLGTVWSPRYRTGIGTRFFSPLCAATVSPRLACSMVQSTASASWPMSLSFWCRPCADSEVLYIIVGYNRSQWRDPVIPTRRTSNRAASPLRPAAGTVDRIDTALGAFFQRLSARIGRPRRSPPLLEIRRSVLVLFVWPARSWECPCWRSPKSFATICARYGRLVLED
jgi:hypothetical protein